MTDYDFSKESYNKLTDLPNISYNLASYLIENDDFCWKLLKYPEPDAWDRTNLTKAEKGQLIYDGIKPETSCRVFFDLGQDDSWTVEASFLRMAVIDVTPTNHIRGLMSIGFEIYTHYKIGTLSNYTTRNVAIAQKLVEVFNGAEIGGLGRMFFDRRASSRCKLMTIGQIPYKGIGIIMSNHIA